MGSTHLTHPQTRGGLQGVLSRRGRRACARRKAGGLRVSLGRWDPQARGRSARRGLRAAAQPASRGPGPAPPLVPSPPWDSYRAGRATRELPGTLPAVPTRGFSPEAGDAVENRQGRTGRQEPGSRGPPTPRSLSDSGWTVVRVPVSLSAPSPVSTRPGILTHRLWGATPYPSLCPTIHSWGGGGGSECQIPSSGKRTAVPVRSSAFGTRCQARGGGVGGGETTSERS